MSIRPEKFELFLQEAKFTLACTQKRVVFDELDLSRIRFFVLLVSGLDFFFF